MAIRWKEQLGQQIRSARAKKELTQEELQQALEVAGLKMSLTTLKAYESGKWAPDFGDLRIIARVLGTDYLVIDHNIRIDFTDNGSLRLQPLPQQLTLDMDSEGQISIRPQPTNRTALRTIRA